MKRKKITLDTLKSLVIDEIRLNMDNGDSTALDELLDSCSPQAMLNMLGEYADKIELTNQRNPLPLPCIEITSVQVFILKEPEPQGHGKILAYARMVLADQFQVIGLKIVQGANGLYVSYPQDLTYKGEDYRSICYPLTRELRDSAEKVILEKYNEQKK